MKKVIGVILLCWIVFHGTAQNDSINESIDSTLLVESDTTELFIGKKKIIIVSGSKSMADCAANESEENERAEEIETGSWSGVYLSVSGLSIPEKFGELPSALDFMEIDYGRSIGFGINLLEKKFPIGIQNIFLSTGLGIHFRRLSFKDQSMKLFADNDSLWSVSDENVTYKKAFLKTNYLQVPLLLNFSTNPLNTGKNIGISGGIIGSYRFATKMKYVTKSGGDKGKVIDENSFLLSPFQVSATARLTLSNFTLFANWGLVSVFESQVPQVRSFDFGILMSFN